MDSKPDAALEELNSDDEQVKVEEEKEIITTKQKEKEKEEIIPITLGDNKEEPINLNTEGPIIHTESNPAEIQLIELKSKEGGSSGDEDGKGEEPKVIFTEAENLVEQPAQNLIEQPAEFDLLANDRKNRAKKNLMLQIEYQKSVMAAKRELADEYSYLVRFSLSHLTNERFQAIMFGYTTMFSPAFPWSPLILLGTNWIKLQRNYLPHDFSRK